MSNSIEYIFENINYEPSNKSIALCNGKINFNKMNHADSHRIYQTQNKKTFDINNYTQCDINLFYAFILFLENKIDIKTYQRAYMEFFDSMGCVPSIKSIEWNIKKIHALLNNTIMNSILTFPYQVDRFDILKLFLSCLYTHLYETLDKVNIFHHFKNPRYDFSHILYIHKNMIKCQQDAHNIIPVNAILIGKNEEEITINVNYCTDCKMFFLNYTTYQLYKQQYGIMIGNFCIYEDNFNSNAYYLSECSPLKLCGYSVNQIDNFSDKERQYIISKIIDRNIMTKPDIIRYLEYFIHMNGKKRGNEIALSKWKSDLEFTLAYAMESQDQYYIADIRKY